MRLQPVILSGGSGTRLWPLSRQLYPKQLLPLTSEQSLLQDTCSRLDDLNLPVNDTIVICNEEHRFLVAEQLRQIDKSALKIILEPVGKNTAPALTLAALASENSDDVLLVMPADHVIGDLKAFQEKVAIAFKVASQDKIVTFGVIPDRPHTGYGYIKKSTQLVDPAIEAAVLLDSFVEKPDVATAEAYLACGEYLWNSGIFMMKAGIWLNYIQQFNAEMKKCCEQAYIKGQQDLDFFRVDSQSFNACPSDSIDYAVMEKVAMGEAAVIPIDVQWSDVGAWSALREVLDKDANGNFVEGDVICHKSEDSLVYANHRMVATLGIKDMTVVETADAVLVADNRFAEQVKDIVDILKQKNRPEHIMHRRVYRPWGSYEGVDVGERFQVKRIYVNPGASLSLQMHHYRAEHWIVVKGTAKVTCGEKEFLLAENQSTYIPIGSLHRLENPGSQPLEIIEVQSGSYLGEDDIVRYEDKYNRVED